jgi:hypothetical protein
MAGGVANIWGIHPDLSPLGAYPNKDQLRTYSVFFHQRGRFLADMKPVRQLSPDPDTRVLLSRSLQSAVAYREATAIIRVDLSSMRRSLPAEAVDTKKAYDETRLGQLEPKSQTISLPYVSDWVVAIGYFKTNRTRLASSPTAGATPVSTDTWRGP